MILPFFLGFLRKPPPPPRFFFEKLPRFLSVRIPHLFCPAGDERNSPSPEFQRLQREPAEAHFSEEVDYYTLLGLPKQIHDLETLRKAYKAAKDMAQEDGMPGWEDFSGVGFFVIWGGGYVGWNGWMKFGTIGSLGGFGFVK